MTALGPLLWSRISLRHARLSWRQSLAVLAIIATGVAVFTAVRLANRAATQSFESFTERLSGRTEGTIRPTSGELSAGTLREVRQRLGVWPAEILPMVQTNLLSAPEADGSRRAWRLIGTDLLALQNLPEVNQRANRILWQSDETKGGGTLAERLNAPAAVYPSPALALRHGLRPGQEVSALWRDREMVWKVGGILPEEPGQPLPDDLMVADIAEIQRLAGKPDWMTSAEVVVPDGPGAERVRSKVAEILDQADDPAWWWETPENSRAATSTMTAAFRMNLSVLSLVGLLTGLYLIHLAWDAAVVRRRPEIAILRSLGVTPAQIRQAWMAEALAFGLLGGLAGALLGVVAAQGAVRAVSATINQLYAAAPAGSAWPEIGDIVGAVALGVGCSLVAGWRPAREAALTPPAQLLGRARQRVGWSSVRWLSLGFFLLCLGLWCAARPPLSLEGGAVFPWGGHASALCWLLGVSALAAGSVRGAALLVRPWARFSPVARLVHGRLTHAGSRHRTAAATLVIATGMAAGTGIMTHSFERTLTDWIGQVLQGDLFVNSRSGSGARGENAIPSDVWAELALDPRVARVLPVTVHRIRLEGHATLLLGIDFDAPQMWLVPPSAGVALVPAAGASTVEPAFVSESFARRFQAGVGKVMSVPTPKGPQPLVVQGIYAEYGNEAGSVSVAREAAASWWNGDASASRLTVRLKPAVDAEKLRDQWMSTHAGLEVRTNAALRSEVLRVFRQTFAVTNALRIIGLLVAAAGLALSLVCLVLESRGELRTLRSLGMSDNAIARAGAMEAVGVALVALLPSLGLSLWLGWVLVHVINKQSFGWTLLFEVPWDSLAWLGISLLAVAALTGWLVVRWALRLPVGAVEE